MSQTLLFFFLLFSTHTPSSTSSGHNFIFGRSLPSGVHHHTLPPAMSSWFSSLNPMPAFPAYTGEHTVGSIDVEIPATDLPSPSFTPEDAPSTVAFRVFYPCQTSLAHPRPVRWIPQPQHQLVAAFAKFLGANHRIAELIA